VSPRHSMSISWPGTEQSTFTHIHIKSFYSSKHLNRISSVGKDFQWRGKDDALRARDQALKVRELRQGGWVGGGERVVARGLGSGKGVVPLPENFWIFDIITDC